MNRTSIRRALVPGVAALALILSACGAGNEDSTNTDGGSTSLSGDLAGGGATSQEKAQAAWRAGFQTANPDVTVNYDLVGSGTGRQNFISGAYAFAGSDSAITDDEGELSDAAKRCGTDSVVQIPAYVSPIAVLFNVPGVDSLDLSPDVVAAIFAGSITKWNDPKIAGLNPDAKLPATDIVPVHRSDDSGTTDNFTDYLNQAGGWKFDHSGTWPADLKNGESAEGTSGVTGLVSDNAGYITYADASAAGALGVVSLKVGDAFQAPEATAAAKTLAVSPLVEGNAPTDMAFAIDRTTTEAGAYPLILVSYLIACPSYPADQADLVKGYLDYVISDEGQSAAHDESGSAPLDAKVAADAKTIVDGITAQ